jgi:hypothetical protein
VLGGWDKKFAVQSGHLSIEELRDSGRQSVCDGILDKTNNGALEEDFEGGSEVGPDVSPDLDINIVAVDVNEDINSTDSGDDLAIGQSLGGEG